VFSAKEGKDFMTPEEIVTEINRKNRAALFSRTDCQALSTEEILTLMDTAAMQGFQFGSNVALSMVQGALLVQVARTVGTSDKPVL
jgi:hypothetical protein